MALGWHYKYQNYRIGPFYNGLAAIFYEKVREEWIDGSYGESDIKKVSYVEIQKIVCYIDEEGEEVIPQGKYDTIGKYCEGFISIELKGKWGFVNTLGEEVVPPKYDGVGDFNDGGVAKIWLNGKIGWITNKGMEVVPPKPQ